MLVKIVDKIADRVRRGYLTAFVLLLISYILTFYTTQKLLQQANWLNHTNRVINTLDVLQATVRDGESAVRGYIITKDTGFLDLYYSSNTAIASLFKSLDSLINDNPVQMKKLDSLHQAIDQKYSLIARGLRIYQSHDREITDSLKQLASDGRILMNDVRGVMQRMQDEEKGLMSGRSGRLSSFSNLIKIITIGSLIVAILLTLYSMVTFTRENEDKKEADKKAKAFREQLELRIDELAAVNKELVELKGIEKFAATGRISRTIAHEIRNPLTNINLAAEHVRAEITPTAETNLLLDMITRNTNRINQLISDLLNSTKITQLDFSRVALNDILDESLRYAQDRLELKGVKVLKNYTSGPCNILADTEKLKIAFLNVIVNAIEAMEPFKGILEIKTEKTGGRCVATITDNGKGMNKEHLSKLFEPYFTTKENGTGLGLAHTQNIIIGHKASILADSDEGKGSSFIISLNYV